MSCIKRVSECVHLCVCLQIVASFCLPRGIFRENIQQRVVRYKCFEARRQTLKTHQRSLPRAAQGLGLTASMEDGMHRMHLAIRPSRLQSAHSSQCAAEPISVSGMTCNHCSCSNACHSNISQVHRLKWQGGEAPNCVEIASEMLGVSSHASSRSV